MGASNILLLGVLGAAISLWGLWPIWGRPKQVASSDSTVPRRRAMTRSEKARTGVGVLTFVVTAMFTVVVIGFVVSSSHQTKWWG